MKGVERRQKMTFVLATVKTGVYIYIVPVITVVTSVFILKEPVT